MAHRMPGLDEERPFCSEEELLMTDSSERARFDWKPLTGRELVLSRAESVRSCVLGEMMVSGERGDMDLARLFRCGVNGLNLPGGSGGAVALLMGEVEI